MTRPWHVYMVQCIDGTLYTGVARDLDRRLRQHNDGSASRYTRCRRPVKLVHSEPSGSRSEAQRREAAIKALDRGEKLRLLLSAPQLRGQPPR